MYHFKKFIYLLLISFIGLSLVNLIWLAETSALTHFPEAMSVNGETGFEVPMPAPNTTPSSPTPTSTTPTDTLSPPTAIPILRLM